MSYRGGPGTPHLSAEDDGGVCVVAGFLLLYLRKRRADFFNDHGPNAGKIEASQKRIYVELSRTREIDQKLHQQASELVQLPWEFIDSGNTRAACWCSLGQERLRE
jgi:hypothetical protein